MDLRSPGAAFLLSGLEAIIALSLLIRGERLVLIAVYSSLEQSL